MLEVPGKPGEIIADRYVLRELIGRGGMGAVWLAEHKTLKSSAAVKLLSPALAVKDEARQRFLREAQSSAALKGSCFVRILDHGVDAGVPYIAMELLEGESLGARLRRLGRLAPEEAAPILRDLVRAIARAHKAGIVHRDVKPDNVFLARDEDAGATVVKVLDFGIAKLVEEHGRLDGEKSTRTGAMLGTPFYMSPEQARGKKDLDGRSDLWSIAVIAVECLTGKRPFAADILGELVMQICSEPIPVPSSLGDVPSGFDAWFARATQRDPAKRFQTAEELGNALGMILTPGTRWVETRVGDSTGGDRASTSPRAPLLETGVQVHAPNAVTVGAATTSVAAQDARARGSSPARFVVVLATAAVVALVVYAVARPSTSEGEGFVPPRTTVGAQAASPAITSAAPPSSARASAPSGAAPAATSIASSAPTDTASPGTSATSGPRKPPPRPTGTTPAPARTIQLGI